MERLEKMKSLLMDEIGMIADKNNLTPQELDNAMKSVCLLREIDDYIGDPSMEGYGRDNSMGSGRYYGTYSTDYSGARMRNSRNGRYMSSHDYGMDGGRGRDYSMSSYNDSYSGHSEDDLIKDLEMKLNHAKSDRERQTIMDTISILRSNRS